MSSPFLKTFFTLCIFTFISLESFGQNDLRKIMEFADLKMQEQDYFQALSYYEQARIQDSTNLELCWKYAEALRFSKNYVKAANAYKEVYSREETAIYPSSLLYWALMEKQAGNFTDATELFKRAKKKYAKKKDSYNYLKSKREVETMTWITTAIKDSSIYEVTALPSIVQGRNSEFAHSLIAPNTLIYSTFYSNSEKIDLKTPYLSELYLIQIDSSLEAKEELIKALNVPGKNVGNGSFSADGKRFYMSLCDGKAHDFTCKIAVSRYEKQNWSSPQLLSELINSPGYSTSTPHVALIDNEEWLFFSSTKENGEGGTDIYFSILKNDGNQFGKVKTIKAINSIENETCPFYDSRSKRLYFSSQWWNGFGGYDVHYSDLENGTWTSPKNAGVPINSAGNDMYFFKAGDSIFVSSNRKNTAHAGSETCCSDVYGFHVPNPPVVPMLISKKETLEELNKRLPVTLYFHNDCPDPKTTATTTSIDYFKSYEDYFALLPNYRTEYAKGLSGEKQSDAEEDIETFFTEYVQKGYNDLTYFQNVLFDELEKGFRIRLNVRGFASPLARTEYNVSLTKRRIKSLENHLQKTDNGRFLKYLNGTAENGGKLEIEGLPFGEYIANQVISDNPNDQKNSVYSRNAASERKIEIQSVSYLQSDSLYFMVDITPNTLLLGKVEKDETNLPSLYLSNNSSKTLIVDTIGIENSCLQFVGKKEILPGEKVEWKVIRNSNFPNQIFNFSTFIYFKEFEQPIRVVVLGEGY
jgi:tetratricopeptide (TPR) repeat protein